MKEKYMIEKHEKEEILDAIYGLSARMDLFSEGQQELQRGQQEMRGSIKSLEVGQQEMRGSIKSLEVGQQEMRGSIKSLEEGQSSLEAGQQELHGSIRSLEAGQKSLAIGQQEMRGSIKSLEAGQRSLEAGQQEMHEMIQMFATHVDERFDRVDQRFDRLEGRVETLEVNVGSMRAAMVTKEYLDDKLAEHGSRYGELIRQTNGKIELLADALVKEKSLSSVSAKKVISAEPFGRR
jgi:chromosome segregation ATPase